jgi:predicted TPR repeat methyltransferase
MRNRNLSVPQTDPTTPSASGQGSDPAVEVSFDEALKMAMGLHRDMRLDGAEALYRRLLALQPDDANVQHFLGMLLYQRQRLADRDEAIRLMTASVVADPSVAAWHNNLGIALLDGGEHDAAANAFQRCVSLDPTNVDAMSNLGCLLRALGRMAESEQSFRQALALQPDFATAHTNLASLLATTGRLPEAQQHFARSLELQPLNPAARKLLGVVYAHSGRLDEAAAVFREWAAIEPDNVQAHHHLAAVTGENVPVRAADAYVVEVFDQFASSFDERLATLGYQAPRLVGEALAGQLGAPAGRLDMLDAGAGTGLCVPWLTPYARRLVGVDLSAGMLAKARRRGGYHELVTAELVAYLDQHPGNFHVIVSADTLCYFGQLEGAMRAAHRALRPDGLLVFTVEAQDEADAGGPGHRLQPHGRYCHGRAYVLDCLAGAGLDRAAAQPVLLRNESGKAVHGWLVTARRPAAANASAAQT